MSLPSKIVADSRWGPIAYWPIDMGDTYPNTPRDSVKTKQLHHDIDECYFAVYSMYLGFMTYVTACMLRTDSHSLCKYSLAY
jgi:hypothetical protein